MFKTWFCEKFQLSVEVLYYFIIVQQPMKKRFTENDKNYVSLSLKIDEYAGGGFSISDIGSVELSTSL